MSRHHQSTHRPKPFSWLVVVSSAWALLHRSSLTLVLENFNAVLLAILSFSTGAESVSSVDLYEACGWTVRLTCLSNRHLLIP